MGRRAVAEAHSRSVAYLHHSFGWLRLCGGSQISIHSFSRALARIQAVSSEGISMAKNTWTGEAPLVNQVDTLTVGSSTAGHTFVIALKHPSGMGSAVTMGTYVAGAAESTTTIANAIYYMLTTGSSAGSSGTGAAATLTYNHPWVRAMSFSQTNAVITCTGIYQGIPFVFSNSGTGTLTRAASTAVSGPNIYSLGGNWGEGSPPAANADIVIQGASSILYGLDSAIGTTTDTFTVQNFSGGIGWPEYPLPVQADEVWQFNCPNARPMYIVNGDTSIVTPLIQVDAIGGSPYGLYLSYGVALGGSLTRLDVRSGRMLFYGYDGTDSTAVLANVSGGAAIDVGLVGSITTTNINDGDVHILPFALAPTTANLVRGMLTIDGTLAMTTANINGGRFVPNSTGTITNMNVNNGVADFLQSRSVRTITNVALDQAGKILADTANVTLGSSAAAFVRTGPIMYSSAA